MAAAARKRSSEPGYKLLLERQKQARRRANLLDPNWTPRGAKDRRFPAFYPGMTTHAYIRTFQALQRKQDAPDLTFVHADRAAPVEVVE